MDWTRIGVSIAVSVALSWRGYRKRSLSTSGAIAAFVTGFIHTMAGYTFTMLLGAFFFTASWLTKYKSHEKSKIEEDFKEGMKIVFGYHNSDTEAAAANIHFVLHSFLSKFCPTQLFFDLCLPYFMIWQQYFCR
jgi:uncharacterized membrane protein